jgi:acyl-CoA thioesterase FadM
MERVRLKIPPKNPIFKTKLVVQIGDLNYGNHVGNDRILLYAHEVRQQFFDSIEQSELSFFGSAVIMSDSTCVYKSQAFWKDQIEAELYLDEITPTSMRLFYRLINNKNKNDIALIQTTLVFFNYDTNKVSPINTKLIPSDWMK